MRFCHALQLAPWRRMVSHGTAWCRMGPCRLHGPAHALRWDLTAAHAQHMRAGRLGLCAAARRHQRARRACKPDAAAPLEREQAAGLDTARVYKHLAVVHCLRTLHMHAVTRFTAPALFNTAADAITLSNPPSQCPAQIAGSAWAGDEALRGAEALNFEVEPGDVVVTGECPLASSPCSLEACTKTPEALQSAQSQCQRHAVIALANGLLLTCQTATFTTHRQRRPL